MLDIPEAEMSYPGWDRLEKFKSYGLYVAIIKVTH